MHLGLLPLIEARLLWYCLKLILKLLIESYAFLHLLCLIERLIPAVLTVDISGVYSRSEVVPELRKLVQLLLDHEVLILNQRLHFVHYVRVHRNVADLCLRACHLA